MGLLSKIMEKLGIGRDDNTHTTAPTPDVQTPVGTPPTPVPPSTPTSTPTPASTTPQGSAQSTLQPVDVGAKLDALAAQHSETLNWRTSIVDLLKLLNIDSSLDNRKELAKELNYSGSTDDSATMNVWLHKAVMTKLAENGGQLPADLHN
ncbi:DUF3597 domain-containing protein [Pseudomonas auratipiscis]|uniref:DUF3597 domain-containing protein n=1 Tax=Pseudomonas auratipiscis TaxID=3115853 RepID=A0AB35WTX1_9PSED|nr:MULTISPECIES: DUF3597 domain-containing protein [unclassified Pseudomonas]MEE1868058.1 DUF3597 domain-containing protein [Pseudomonas sp. 120P]MEE1959071.1 DUF3597 domain-containing protein [Pseudomonas sp. 119P]